MRYISDGQGPLCRFHFAVSHVVSRTLFNNPSLNRNPNSNPNANTGKRQKWEIAKWEVTISDTGKVL